MTMKIQSSILAGILMLGMTAYAQNTYSIDPAHSAADFKVKHMMISNVQGEFSNVKGLIIYDPAHLEAAKVDATVDVTTLNTRDADRDKHLKSPDFFDAAKFPSMTFQSTKFVQANGKTQVQGNLTLHGVTKPVVLDLDGPSPEVKDPWGNFRRGVTATTTLRRQDFGLVWNKNLDGGGVLIGDDVTVTLNIEGVRKAASATATK
jgi:polyisoprenoid-binding protein YceI